MKKSKLTSPKIPKIKSLSLAIGQSCFLYCPGCYNHFSSGTISRKDIFYFVKFIRDNYGLEKVTLSGGDPLSRVDILDILADIKSLGLKINLDTAGTPLLESAPIKLLGEGVIKKIPLKIIADHVDLLGLPMDGPNNTISNKFRKGRPKYLDEVVRLIHDLGKYDLDICINTVIHKDNLDSLEDIADKLQTMPNVVRWQLFQFNPSGPGGYTNRHKYYISDQEFSDAVETLKEYVVNKKLKIILDCKSMESRKNAYILVDGAGTVWSPKVISEAAEWMIDDKSNSERVVFGNINDRKSIRGIIEQVFKYRANTN